MTAAERARDGINCCGEVDRRVVCWFSCGATSAIATKMALQEFSDHETHVVYTDPGSEHPDNMRFLRDVEKWIDHPITILKSDKYKDTWDVWEKTGWLVGVEGARCTTELKKNLRVKFEEPDDIQIFGFDVSERKRATLYRENNPGVDLRTPLIDANLTKPDCLAMLQHAGIALPALYELGFRNANCIGCVKGQAGYWNKIRRVFPDVFSRMAAVEHKMGVAINKRFEPIPGSKKKKRIRIFLEDSPTLKPDDEVLEVGAGRDDEVMPDCSLLCAIAESELDGPR